MLGFLSYLLLEGLIDELEKIHPNVPVREYAAKDPTPQKKYLRWLVSQHKKGKVTPDHPDLEPTLQNFDRYKRQHGIIDHQQHNFDEIADKIRPLIGTAATKKEIKNQQKIEGTEQIHEESNGIKAFHIKTKEASQNLYGGGEGRGGERGGIRGTSWCVSARSDDCLFEKVYGKLYTIHDPNDDNAPYAVHPQRKLITSRFNDGDRHISKVLEEKPHLKTAVNKVLTHYENHKTPDDKLYDKFTDEPENVNEDDIYNALKSDHGSLPQLAVSHPKTTSLLLHQALMHDDPNVRNAALLHKNINKNHLMVAAEDPDVFNRETVANHSMADDDIHEKLMHDTEPSVRQIVAQKVNSDNLHKMLKQETNSQVWGYAAENPNFNVSHIRLATLGKNPGMLNYVLENRSFVKKLDPNTLSNLIHKGSYRTRQLALESPNISSNDITKVLSYKNLKNSKFTYQDKMNIIKNAKNITSKHLDIALNDDDTEVVKSAIYHPNITKNQLRKFIENNNPQVRYKFGFHAFGGPYQKAHERLKEMENIKEEFLGIPTVNVSSGQVAGTGIQNPNIPNQAEPGIKKKKTAKTFKLFRRGIVQ